MSNVCGKLTVYFEKPFWVGIFEYTEEGKLTAAKVTFGAEPKDYEVYEFILKKYYSLRFSPAVETVVKERRRNPKRIQREIRKHLQDMKSETKSQQAIKLQQEQNKQERKRKKREKKLAEAERIFERKQEKKKEKHRGR